MVAPRAHTLALVVPLALLVCAPLAAENAGVPWPDAPPGSQVAAAEDGDDPRVVTTLVVDAEVVAPGDVVRVGVHFAMDTGWHVYWRNPGQGAYATEVTFAGPGDFGPLRWPAPETFTSVDGFITTYGYGGEVVLWSEWRVPADADGVIELRAVADFLTCEVDCIPGRTELVRAIPVGEAAPAGASTRELFAGTAALTPGAPDDVGVERAELLTEPGAVRPGDTFRAVIAVAACLGPRPDDPACPSLDVARTRFVPDRTAQIEWTIEGRRAHPTAATGVVVDLAGRAGLDAVPPEQQAGGVLSLVYTDGRERHVEVRGTLRRAPAGAEVALVAHPVFAALDAPPLDPASGAQSGTAARPEVAARAPLPLLRVLLLAFLGGALLNLMPCVLPVLALKVAGFAELVQHDRRSIAAHAAAYAAGVVGSLLILAIAVLAVRAGGAAVGWGFQFQHPGFVATVAAVLVLFAANLFGAWELNVDATRLDETARRSGGLGRSALEGVLTVVLATPCSAPFLGTAVGFALAGSGALVLGVFVALGLGLAAPFVALSLIPGARRLVPRPGAWMETLRQLLGFALLGALVWVVWVFAQLAGVDALGRLLAWLVGVALVAWAWGRVQLGRSRGARAAVAALALAVLAGGVAIARTQPAPPEAHDAEAAWRPWSPAAVDAALAAGRPVFVDFTADWCITCKVNERGVLAAERVMAAFAERGVELLIADWTQRDDTIAAELARFGKAGVPLYVLHVPGADTAPIVLPELLTIDRVFAELSSLPSP